MIVVNAHVLKRGKICIKNLNALARETAPLECYSLTTVGQRVKIKTPADANIRQMSQKDDT